VSLAFITINFDDIIFKLNYLFWNGSF